MSTETPGSDFFPTEDVGIERCRKDNNIDVGTAWLVNMREISSEARENILLRSILQYNILEEYAHQKRLCYAKSND